MKRSRIVVLLVLVVALALPALVHADAARAGWTWDENAAITTDPTTDGWTWDESTTVTTDAPVPDSATPVDAAATPVDAAATQASP